MPVYEYHCPKKKCGKTMTVVRKVEDRDKGFKCLCGSTPKRQPSRTSPPKFLGDGFTEKFH